MRFVLLVCLCVAAAVASKVKEDVKTVKETAEKADKHIDTSAKKEDLIKKFEEVKNKVLKEDEDVKVTDSDKTWGQVVDALTPTAEVFAANLPMYTKSKIKPEIAMAFNLEEELSHWNKEGNPNHLEFIGDEGEPAFAVMSSNQPVFLASYAEDVKFHLFTKL